MKNMSLFRFALAAGALACLGAEAAGVRVAALEDGAWRSSEWISVKDASAVNAKKVPSHGDQRAAPGTSRFCREVVNAKAVKRAVWMTTGLGVYEIYVNGERIGDDFLKPGFTHAKKTKRSLTYDVTELLKTDKGSSNLFAAEVSAGWWRDKIVHFAGKKSAFRGVVKFTYEDGATELVGTKAEDWTGSVGGPVTHAAIFDGEEYDARVSPLFAKDGVSGGCEKNEEFNGEILPSDGAEVTLRHDLALNPVEAYSWQGVTGENRGKKVFGKIVKTRTFKVPGPLEVVPGETLVVDFGQNCAANPAFEFEAAEGTVLTCLPAEMLNDSNGERSRGNDGPAGSVYRENLRCPHIGMRVVYTFGKDGKASYMPRFTFFGYRYVSITATAKAVISSLKSVPVTSIKKELELGKIETGVEGVNKLISNVYWGQLSNYLSVPTDCPQRNERLGWTADTQVFTEAGSFNTDTSAFLRKWMRDMRDSQHELGGFPGVAPQAQYGGQAMRFGWADAGVIVPYQVWKQFGDKMIVEENWQAMEKFVARVAMTKYAHEAIAKECENGQWADWLSYEKVETGSGQTRKTGPDGKRDGKADVFAYWDYLGGCYWIWDAQLMAVMADATGRAADAEKYRKMAEEAKAYVKSAFFSTSDGMILDVFRHMQTPALFALKLGLVEGKAREATIAALKQNFKEHGDCLQTGFLGTSILMDTLTENGMTDIAYTLLLQRKNPSWLYSVDQGATTIWERWNSYVKDTGFGLAGMNSFNHYAYGAVLAWIYKTAAGIAADPKAPGFKNIIMAPKPDRRLGHVNAEYKSAAGLIKSAWRYEGEQWIWEFTVPKGTTASVTIPGENVAKSYTAGSHKIVK